MRNTSQVIFACDARGARRDLFAAGTGKATTRPEATGERHRLQCVPLGSEGEIRPGDGGREWPPAIGGQRL